MLEAVPYHVGAFFTRFAPKWVCRAITRTLGEVNWWLRPGTRRLVFVNLGILHPEWSVEERRRVAHEVVQEFANSILLFLELPFLAPDDVFARCDLSALRAELDRLDRGRGFVIATAHIGPWELGGYCLTHMGYVVNTVALNHPSRSITKFYSDRRDYIGVRAHPLGGSFGDLKEALDRGECVALLIDRAYGRARKRVQVFGVSMDFALGHVVLSARAGVPIITGALLFDGKDRFRYVHGGTHHPDESLDEFDRLDALHEACAHDLERIIRAHSEQWFHFFPLSEGNE